MITVEELRGIALFEKLSDQQLAELLEVGEEIIFAPGMELFHEGDHSDFWFVLIEGCIDLLRRVGHEETVLAVLGSPGRWAGGFRAWDEGGQYLATGRATAPGRVLRVPSGALRTLAMDWFPLAVHLIDGVFNTARNVEQSARQRSALVTLGTLSAGLAHELNNPASAATRAVESLHEVNHGLLESLARLGKDGLGAEQFTALDALRRELQARPGRSMRWPSLTPRMRSPTGWRTTASNAHGRWRLPWPQPTSAWTGASGSPTCSGNRTCSQPSSGWPARSRSTPC